MNAAFSLRAPPRDSAAAAGTGPHGHGHGFSPEPDDHPSSSSSPSYHRGRKRHRSPFARYALAAARPVNTSGQSANLRGRALHRTPETSPLRRGQGGPHAPPSPLLAAQDPALASAGRKRAVLEQYGYAYLPRHGRRRSQSPSRSRSPAGRDGMELGSHEGVLTGRRRQRTRSRSRSHDRARVRRMVSDRSGLRNEMFARGGGEASDEDMVMVERV